MKSVRLKKDADRRIKAGHLWVFSNDIDTQQSPLKNYTPGELIRIETAHGTPIATGYINPHCLLCIRILSLNVQDKIDTDFFIRKIQTAQAKRETIFTEKYYRVVFGESDRLPGVVIDQFNNVVVMQINTAGMENLKAVLINAVLAALKPATLFLKCDSTERGNEGLTTYTETIHGTLPKLIHIEENNCVYEVTISQSQKTGWFFDHRYNRARITRYAVGKRVLDVFSYCGAFTIPCAKNGATEIIAIDRSQSAIEQLQKNAALNALDNIKTICGDALESMQTLIENRAQFDVIILDPPAFIKRKKDIKAGEKMYEKCNELALRLLTHGGVLFSASCSMHLSATDLLNTIRRAGITAKKELSVLEQCHQGPDHPVHPAIAETNYLKGFILAVS